MDRLPFTLSITCRPPETGIRTLECKTLLRRVPKIRCVYDAVWEDRCVIAKVFTSPVKAPLHLMREWRGLERLRQLGLQAPRPLFAGVAPEGWRVIVTAWIPDSSNVLRLFEQAHAPQHRFELIAAVATEVARHHAKGVVQKDLHLGNFLLADGKVFSLDPAQIKFNRKPLSPRKGTLRLLPLLCSMRDSSQQAVDAIVDIYAAERGFRLEDSDRRNLYRHIERYREKWIRKYLRKCLRSSTRNCRQYLGPYRMVFDRDFASETDMAELAGRLDALMSAGHVIKDANTCSVSRTNFNGRDIVVKRYNDKGALYALRNTLKGSRARKSWLFGHRLSVLSIPTPQPLAFIEYRKALLLRKSYIITGYVHGKRFSEIVRDADDTGCLIEVTHSIEQMLEAMGRFNITHGDLKHPNILISEEGPVITDLDAMTHWPWRWLYNIRKSKDTERFVRDLPNIAD